MRRPNERLARRLPERFPLGATYVVEGFGAQDGDLRVIARYVVFPGGQRVNVPADLGRAAALARALTLRRNASLKQSHAGSRSRSRRGKKSAGRRGTR